MLPAIEDVDRHSYGTVAYGALFLGESLNLLRSLCLVMIVAGIVGLKLASPG